MIEEQDEARREALARLSMVAKAQAVEPFDLDRVRAKADFWPDDESIDDFLVSVRRWRDEEDAGSQP